MGSILVYSDFFLDDLCALEYLSKYYESLYLVPINVGELAESDYAADSVRNLADIERTVKQWFKNVTIFENGVGTAPVNVEMVFSLANVTKLVSDFKVNDFLKSGKFDTVAMIGEYEGKYGYGNEWNASQDIESYKELFDVCPDVIQLTQHFCENKYAEHGYPFMASFLGEYIDKMEKLNDSVCCYDLIAVYYGRLFTISF